jgi:hypothetical protein
MIHSMDGVEPNDPRRTPPAIATWSLAVAGISAVLVVVLLVQLHGLRRDVERLRGEVVAAGQFSAPDAAPPQDDLCRLLGALAGAQGIDQSRLFQDQSVSDCEQAADAAARSARSGVVTGSLTVTNDLPPTIRATYCVAGRGCGVEAPHSVGAGASTVFAVREAAGAASVRVEVHDRGPSGCLLLQVPDFGRVDLSARASEAQPVLC